MGIEGRNHNFLDMTGKRFGRLTVVEYVGNTREGRAEWRCVCDCGKTIVAHGKNIRRGNTKSCGCLKLEKSTKRIVDLNTTHGMAHSRLHRIWHNMRVRCACPSFVGWEYYGGKGITVCGEWQTFEPFYKWAMENGYSDDLTIDRIDSDKGYSPDNCRWATTHEQALNKKATRFITFMGKTQCMADWSKEYGMGKGWLNGLTDEEAVAKLERKYNEMQAKGSIT